MESTERDLAMGDKGGGLGPDGGPVEEEGEVITAPTIPEPADVPAPPIPGRS